MIHGVLLLSHMVYMVKASEIVSSGSSSLKAIASDDRVHHRKLVSVEPCREVPKQPPSPIANDRVGHLPPPWK